MFYVFAALSLLIGSFLHVHPSFSNHPNPTHPIPFFSLHVSPSHLRHHSQLPRRAAVTVFVVLVSNLDPCLSRHPVPSPSIPLFVIIPFISLQLLSMSLLFLGFQSSLLGEISFLSFIGPFLAFLAYFPALPGVQPDAKAFVIQGRR